MFLTGGVGNRKIVKMTAFGTSSDDKADNITAYSLWYGAVNVLNVFKDKKCPANEVLGPV